MDVQQKELVKIKFFDPNLTPLFYIDLKKINQVGRQLRMFGILDIRTCGLEKTARRFYACCVCDALASEYGRHCRLMLGTDSIYLSLLMASQREKIGYDYSARPPGCRLWPKITLSHVDFAYPAAVSVTIAGAKLLDETYDRDSIRPRILLHLYRHKVRRAEERLRKLGLEIDPVEIFVRHQHLRERVCHKGFDYYSKQTEQIYSKVFSHTSVLANAPHNFEYLSEVGLQVGRIAYLLDSYVDLWNDCNKGVFNACLNADPHPEMKRPVSGEPKEQLKNRLSESLKTIGENIPRIKFYRFSEEMKYALTVGLRNRVQAAISSIRYTGSSPTFYLSLAPFVALSVARLAASSGNGSADCEDPCSCCETEDPCSDGGSSDGGSFLPQTQAEQTATEVAQGAISAAIGTTGGILLSEVASRIGGSVPPTDTSPKEVDVSSTTPTPYPQFDSGMEPPPPNFEYPDGSPILHDTLTLEERYAEELKKVEERYERDTKELGTEYDAEELRKIKEEKLRKLVLKQEFNEILDSRPEWMKKMDIAMEPRTFWSAYGPGDFNLDTENYIDLRTERDSTGRPHTLWQERNSTVHALELSTRRLQELTPGRREEYERWLKRYKSYQRRVPLPEPEFSDVQGTRG